MWRSMVRFCCPWPGLSTGLLAVEVAGYAADALDRRNKAASEFVGLRGRHPIYHTITVQRIRRSLDEDRGVRARSAPQRYPRSGACR
jgi:hypothetical protein